MDILTKQVSFEETIKGSRFLSELIPCNSQSQARILIKEKKTQYENATHVVHAFIIGNNAEIMGMSDDGEPSGTAGRPTLDVLKGKNCTNVLITITRWFGGTLLGTGGLVKAYSNGAKQVILKAAELNAFSPLIQKKSFSFRMDYALHKNIKKALENFELYDLKEDFGTDVTLCGEIAEKDYSNFANLIKNLSNGKINLS